MRTTTININVYEVGDVIQLDRADLSLEAKRRSYGNSRRAVIMSVGQRMDKLFTYKAIADNGKMFTFTPNEQGREQYIGHIDMGLLLGGDSR